MAPVHGPTAQVAAEVMEGLARPHGSRRQGRAGLLAPTARTILAPPRRHPGPLGVFFLSLGRPMRKSLLLLPFFLACAKADDAKTDSSAMAVTPMSLTDADVSGTWQGTSMLMGSDSVIAHWTQVCGAGSCRGTQAESKDTILSTYTLAADSATGASAPFAQAAMKGAKLVDHWVVHVKDGKATGTGMMTLADKPDSVVMRYRFEGSRAP